MSKSELSGALVAFLLLAVAAGPGCAPGPEDQGRSGGSRTVVCTTGFVADVASRIAGGKLRVVALVGPGVDPHLYKASERDVRRLSEADLILYNGLQLEGKVGDILEKMSHERPVVAVTEAIPRDLLRSPPEFQGQYDPHVWLDVSLWSRTVEPVTRALSSVAPEHAAEFATNASALRTDLEELDRWTEQQIRSIPERQRVLVTAHDAFGYFGRRYGMEVVAIQGISTLAEAGLADIERVVDRVVSGKVKAIFIESSVPRRAVESVQAACRARGHEVSIGGQLYSDALGAPGSAAGTYDGMVRANVRTIVEGLR